MSPITLANYVPRLGRGVTILLTQIEDYNNNQPYPKVAIFTQQVIQALTELTASLQDNRPILPLPPFDETVEDILSHFQQSPHFVEIIRRVEAIHTSIRRFKGLSPAK